MILSKNFPGVQRHSMNVYGNLVWGVTKYRREARHGKVVLLCNLIHRGGKTLGISVRME